MKIEKYDGYNGASEEEVYSQSDKVHTFYINENNQNFFKFAILFAVSFMIIGFFVLHIGINNIQQYQVDKEALVDVAATITDIEGEYYTKGAGKNKSTSVAHNVYVSYEYNGEVYTDILDYYHSAMREGEQVMIKVNSRNPSLIYTNTILSIAFEIICGMVFVIIGFVMLRAGWNYKRQQNEWT